MRLTLLIDLDDTLLDSNFGEFLPAYFQGLAEYLSHHFPKEHLIEALIAGTKRMYENQNPEMSLQVVFEDYFYPKLGVPKKDLVNEIEQFYDEVFPGLGKITRPRQDAQDFIKWAVSQDFRIAIATDPVFPRKATYQRVKWAGFDPEAFELITTFEDFHFSKNQPAYYSELLGQLGWPDGPIIMTGNDVQRDILNAQQTGFITYQLSSNGQFKGSVLARSGKGNFAKLREWISTSDLASFSPDFHSREAQLTHLTGTPASLNSLMKHISPADWKYKPGANDWSLNEIVCHLRDAEREIHQMQIRLFDEEEDPFIPRPDAEVWARQRKYLSEDGRSALKEFSLARQTTLGILKASPLESWSRKARHSIFGPTNFLEVVEFMSEHDRLHTHQVWKTLREINV